MTRQEQLNEAWCKYRCKCSTELMQALAFALRWCDEHPNWISLEDGFPPFDFKNDGTWKCSYDVLIFSPLRGIFVGRYECDDMAGKTYWVFDNSKLPTVEDTGEDYCLTNITHWMQLPAPPEKGVEQ